MSSPLPVNVNRLGWAVLVMAACVAWGIGAEPAGAADALDVGPGKVASFTDTGATIEFSLAEVEGRYPEATVFYGREDGGTSEANWSKNTGAVKPDAAKGPGKYAVELSGLTPDAAYYYRVKAGTDWSASGEFRTAATAAPWYVSLGWFAMFLAMLIVPVAVGFLLADHWRMPDYGWKLALIFFLLTWSVYIVTTRPIKRGIDLSGGVVLVYELAEEPKAAEKPGEAAPQTRGEKEAISKEMMNKLVSAIQLRVDPGGTRNVDIRTCGKNQIEVLIPRANPDEVRRIRSKITSAGQLIFRILADKRDRRPEHREAITQGLQTAEDKVFNAEGMELGWWIPVRQAEEKEYAEDANLVTRRAPYHGKDVLKVLVVADPYNVEGRYLSQCSVGFDEKTLRPCVDFSFNRAGSRLFGALTGANEPTDDGLSRRLGIILDDYLYSAPVIQTRIQDRGQITSGSFTKQEVQDLVDVLNAGSLPTALKKNPISEQECGPTLGTDMIRRGVIATILSLVCVFVFMTGYYRFAGLVASAAVVMNLFLLLAVMDIVKGFDMTLPGIAGFVLGLGMAVDANVLIFERMREELDRGATLRMAIRNGFDRALSVIIDSNLTGLITAVILYAVGTSQVKGFAVTLGLSIVFSMFTAVFCSRVVFDIGDRRGWIKKLSMMRLIRPTRFDFMGRMSLYGVGLSVTLLFVGLVAVGFRGQGLLDIDFTGGESVQLLFKEPQKIEDVRKTLREAKDADGNELFPDLTVNDTQIRGEPSGKRFLVDTSRAVDEEKLKKTSLEVVEADLREIFKGKLATNTLSAGEITPIGPAAESKPAAEERSPKSEAEPAKEEQTRNDLPSSSLLASTDPAAVFLAQADRAAPSGDAPAAGESEPAKPAESTQPEPAESTEKPAAEPATETAAAKDAPKQPAAPEEPKAAESQPAAEQPAAEPAAVAGAAVALPDRFEGGSQVELHFEQPLDHETVKSIIAAQQAAVGSSPAYFEVANENYQLGDTEAYTDWTLKIKMPEAELKEKILGPIVEKMAATPFFPSSSSVGGKVAGDMQAKAIVALLLSLVCVVIYLWVRFQHVMYGLAAVVALVHDVLITLGAVAMSAYLYPVLDKFKIGLTVLAAFLTIIGYSLNDTIVVFDRIREVKGKSPHLTKETVNASINQTLSRTLLTGMTTLFVLLILFYGGGGGLHAFAFTMLVGIITGTYSSVFVASPILYWMTGKTASGKAKTA